MIFSGHVCIAYALKTFAWIGRRIRPEDIRMDKWTHSGVCDTPLHGMPPYMGCLRNSIYFLFIG